MVLPDSPGARAIRIVRRCDEPRPRRVNSVYIRTPCGSKWPVGQKMPGLAIAPNSESEIVTVFFSKPSIRGLSTPSSGCEEH